MRIYLAGPLGFSEAGRAFYYDKFVPTIRAVGVDVLDPWALTDQAKIERVRRIKNDAARCDEWRALNLEIARENTKAIDSADALVAVLDGPDVDSGTAAEIGYAFARNRPILGYRGDFRLSADNEGSIVNMQVEYFIRASGGTIVRKLEDLSKALAKMLDRTEQAR